MSWALPRLVWVGQHITYDIKYRLFICPSISIAYW